MRRSDADIIPNLIEFSVSKDDDVEPFHKLLHHHQEVESAAQKMLDGGEKVIFLVVFQGPREAGHWTLLVLDYIRPNQPLAIYFDSFGSDEPCSKFIKLQAMLCNTPLIKKDTK